MGKWYANKVILNALILIMCVGFMAYMFKQSPQIEQAGIVIFLAAGTLVMVRGVVKITMGMRRMRR
ncbi:MAG: hypothetical protein O7E52_04800 [Candidatus Poribacteria bacterium]|nr:hypothetical protein [Candidatus Poribacteria bacterium]